MLADDPAPTARQICAGCEVILTTPLRNHPLPPQYRLILRASLPLPDDDEISSIASSEDDDEWKQLRKKVALVLDQQVAQERRLGERMHGIESKMDGVSLVLDQQIAQGHRLNERMHNLEVKVEGVEAKLDLVLNLLVALHDHTPISPLRQLPNRPPAARRNMAPDEPSLMDV